MVVRIQVVEDRQPSVAEDKVVEGTLGVLVGGTLVVQPADGTLQVLVAAGKPDHQVFEGKSGVLLLFGRTSVVLVVGGLQEYCLLEHLSLQLQLRPDVRSVAAASFDS